MFFTTRYSALWTISRPNSERSWTAFTFPSSSPSLSRFSDGWLLGASFERAAPMEQDAVWRARQLVISFLMPRVAENVGLIAILI